jgi:hypothetical protein
VLVLIELVLAVAALAWSITWPDVGATWFARVEQPLGALARRRKLAVLLVGLAALAGRLAVLPILPVPVPRVPDEFSYLLAAHTFADGRLTNPTPPMWQHFETLHTLMRPTYQSKYPPAQGLVMAAGKVLFGKAFWGVWLSVGVMCAAICWMLQGWLSPELALLGGAIAVLRWGVFSYWADSYWGGAVAAIGGALLLGALPRLLKSAKVRDAFFMGLGLAILANSRPYEGLVLSLPVAFVLFRWAIKKSGKEFWSVARRVALPIALVLLMAGTWMGYYFWRVTGNPLQMPYQTYARQYDSVPDFLWEHLGPTPPLRNLAMKDSEEHFELPQYQAMRTPSGILSADAGRGFKLWLFFAGPALTLPLLVLIFSGPFRLFSWQKLSAEARFLLAALAISIVGLALEVYMWPHYAAPLACLFLALILLSFRYMRSWKWQGMSSGLFLSRAIPLILALVFGLRAAAGPLHIHWSTFDVLASYSFPKGPTQRSRILADLEKRPGQQLVLVRYHALQPSVITGQWPEQWVYNGPDIAEQKVVWAWDLGATSNRKLIELLKPSGVWLVDLAKSPPAPVPYGTQ